MGLDDVSGSWSDELDPSCVERLHLDLRGWLFSLWNLRHPGQRLERMAYFPGITDLRPNIRNIIGR